MSTRVRVTLIVCLVLLLVSAGKSATQGSVGPQRTQAILEEAIYWPKLADLLRKGEVPTDELLLQAGFKSRPSDFPVELGEACTSFLLKSDKDKEQLNLTFGLLKCREHNRTTRVRLGAMSGLRESPIVVPDGILQALIAKGRARVSSPSKITVMIDQSRGFSTTENRDFIVEENVDISLDGTLGTVLIELRFEGVSQ